MPHTLTPPTICPQPTPLLAFLSLAVRIAALVHDLGKATVAFQGRLCSAVAGDRVPKDILRHELVSTLIMDVDAPDQLIQVAEQDCLRQWFIDRSQWLSSEPVTAVCREFIEACGALDQIDSSQNKAARLNFFARKLSLNSHEMWVKKPFWMSVLWLVFTHHKLLRGHWSNHLQCFSMTAQAHINILDDQSEDDEVEQEINEHALRDCLTLASSDQPWDNALWLDEFSDCLLEWKALRSQHPEYESTLFLDASNHVKNGLGESTPWIKALTRMGRLSLVMGDYEASCDAIKGHHDEITERWVFANTKTVADRVYMGDRLHVHLLKTHHFAQIIFKGLFQDRDPAFFAPGTLSYECSPEPLKQLIQNENSPFIWQTHAQQAMASLRGHARGCFAVVASGTGSGKTRSCAGMMAASRDQVRFSVLLSMRSLTFQTAKAYLANNIGYHPDQIAMFVGDDVLKRRFRDARKERRKVLREQRRMASMPGNPDQTQEERYSVLYSGQIEEVLDLHSLKDDHFLMRSLSAPVSVMTVDHVIRAINLAKSSDLLQMLNLMSTDLILDEIDDYKGQDLVSIGRLIELAGQFGRRVIIASATLPKTIVEGFYRAYLEGYRVYQEAYGEGDPDALVITHTAPYAGRPESGQSFVAFYEQTMASFCELERKSAQNSPRRSSVDATAMLAKMDQQFSARQHALSPFIKGVSRIRPGVFSPYSKAIAQQYYFQGLTLGAFEGHRLNAMAKDDLRYSAGAIRLNSVVSAQSYVRWLATSGVRDAYASVGVTFKVICYHAQNLGLTRYVQESFLDNHLKRAGMNHGEPDPLLASADVQQAFEQARQAGHKHVIVLIVTTSIFETGRDYDLDWAVLEPCSTTSIIQFAGRVRRHRSQAHRASNVLLMPCSLESMTNPTHAWRDLKHTVFTPKANRPAKVNSALKVLRIDTTQALQNDPASTTDAFAKELTQGLPVHAGHCLMTPEAYVHAPLTSMERVYQLSLFEKAHATPEGYPFTLEYALHHADAALCDTFYRTHPFRGEGEIVRLEYVPDMGWVSQDETGNVKAVNEAIFNEMGACIEYPDMFLLQELNFRGCEDMVVLSEATGRSLGYQEDDLSLATSALLSTQRDSAYERLTYHPQLGFTRRE